MGSCLIKIKYFSILIQTNCENKIRIVKFSVWEKNKHEALTVCTYDTMRAIPVRSTLIYMKRKRFARYIRPVTRNMTNISNGCTVYNIARFITESQYFSSRGPSQTAAPFPLTSRVFWTEVSTCRYVIRKF